MTIFEAIQHVHATGGHPNQLRYDWPRESIYSYVSIHMAPLQPNTILDAGCAYGTMSYILAKAGLDVTAVDCMPELHNAALFKEAGVKFQKANLETDAIKGKHDVVLLTDVLEHFNYNPLPVLKKLRKAATKGIVITTPAREVDPVMPEEARYKDYVNWKMIPTLRNKYEYEFIDAHHHTYTGWELRELLKEAGFKVVHMKLLPYEKTWVVIGACV